MTASLDMLPDSVVEQILEDAQESYCFVDADGDMWAFKPHLGWDPVIIGGEHMPDDGLLTFFKTVESWEQIHLGVQE